MESKKISFGFSKINKKFNLLPTKENAKTETKVELIKCLEGHEIKLVEEKAEEQPLTIPLKESQKTSAAIASLMKRRAVLLGEEEADEIKPNTAEIPMSANNEGPEDIEERAARELLAEIKKNGSSDLANNLVLPVIKPEDLPLEGAKESTIDDYESIPIQDFGKAMLRGMGWTEPLPKVNIKGGPPIDDRPMVRPKGMGLGADKALNKNTLLIAPEANEVLEVKRNAYVRILGGKHKDLYGQIEGFDDHAGRVIVKMAIGGAKEAFNEFLCQTVARKEFAQYGKCINTGKYEEYKKKENEYGQIILDKHEKYLIDKKEQHIKKEHEEEIYPKNYEDYAKNRKKENYNKKDKREIKKDSNPYREQRNDRNRDEYDCKNYSKDEEIGSRKETNKYDHRDSRKQYDDKDQKGRYKNDVNYRQREHDRHELKSDYKRSQTFRRYDDDEDKKGNSREYDRSYSRNRDAQLEPAERGDKSPYKTIELNSSSDSETDSYSTKHKKYKKQKLKKKSKKSKKSKSKYKSNSSDAETSSSNDTLSSDSEEEKYKKHKKKTKKSKKHRERSRSRGRR